MNRRMKCSRLLMLFVFLAMGLLVISCGPKAVKPVSEMDTPQHHFYTGMKMLDQGRYGDADRSFDRAIELSPKYSMAHAGKGLVKSYQRDFASAIDKMNQAWKYADTNEEKIFVHVGFIRVNSMSHAECINVGWVCTPQDNWLVLSKGEFDKAVAIDPEAAAPYYYMGLCYKTALDVFNAGQMFAKVLSIKKEYITEADREWNLVQKIQRAMPGTITGKQIAFVEQITRADVAAVFMEEMKIDVLYKKRTPKNFDTSFKDPEKAKTPGTMSSVAPTDIANHPLKADIEGIIQMGVRGLEVYPDGTFRPNDFVNRAAYAMMIEDILIKVSGDNTLATKFIGSTSPFPDLRSDLPYFNAVMVVTSRGIMEAKDLTSGEFSPLGPVPGVDALLIIRKIKEELKFF